MNTKILFTLRVKSDIIKQIAESFYMGIIVNDTVEKIKLPKKYHNKIKNMAKGWNLPTPTIMLKSKSSNVEIEITSVAYHHSDIFISVSPIPYYCVVLPDINQYIFT